MYVERDFLQKFVKLSSLYKAVAVVGPRQAGKTTFLKEQAKNLNSNYVLFDDPDARTLFNQDIKKFEKQFVEGHYVTILDEVQECENAGSNLKYLIDSGHKIWLTSSSEILLSKNVLSHLVGRIGVLKTFPFSFHEFLEAKNLKELTPLSLERSVWEQAVYGSYPQVALTQELESKKILLSNLYQTLLLKDVAKTFSINDLQTLENLTKLLAINSGGLLSYEAITRAINSPFYTIKKYLDALEKSYLIYRVPCFQTNKAKELIKQPKTFFIDTGLRNAILNNYPIQVDGQLFENYVFTELLKRGFTPKHWRTKTKQEVDFVIHENDLVIPIEVKLGANSIQRSLASFIDAYQPKNAFIACYETTNKELVRNNCTITICSLDALLPKLATLTTTLQERL